MQLNVSELAIFVKMLILIGFALQALFIVFEHKQKYIPAVILKGSASLMFCLIGFFAFLMNCLGYIPVEGDEEIKGKIVKLVIKGLCLGAAGDILLNLRFVFEKIGQKIFLAGIAVFLAGHIVYLVSLIMVSKDILICIILGLVVAAILLFIIFKSFEVKLSFKIFGIVYISAVCLMASFALGNCINAPSTFNLVFAIGAVLFLVSDVVLIFNTFGPEQKFGLRITNLTLYYIGQILIAVSLFLIK